MRNSERSGRSYVTNVPGGPSFKAQTLLLPGTKRTLINTLLSLYPELTARESWLGYSPWLLTRNQVSSWRPEAIRPNTRPGWLNRRMRTNLLNLRSKSYAENSPTALSRCYSCRRTRLSDGLRPAVAGAGIVM